MIDYERSGDTAWITMNRPEKMNALSLQGWADLRAAIDRASEDARVAVLTGVEDIFCSGDDIAVIDEIETQEDVKELSVHIFETFHAIETADVPVIAAVNGTAYGGGCELTAAADLAVATTGATLALPETRIGAYPAYAVERVAAIGGRKRLMELILTGEPIDATTAHEWGLVNRVVDPDDLAPAVEQLIDSITRSPKVTVAGAKQRVNSRFIEHGELESMVGMFSSLFQTPGSQEAVDAFLESREPEFAE
jgi:enoyl-CoA hydratase/carnithine racemase